MSYLPWCMFQFLRFMGCAQKCTQGKEGALLNCSAADCRGEEIVGGQKLAGARSLLKSKALPPCPSCGWDGPRVSATHGWMGPRDRQVGFTTTFRNNPYLDIRADAPTLYLTDLSSNPSSAGHPQASH